MVTIKNIGICLAVFVALVVGAYFAVVSVFPKMADASANIGHEYQSTTTPMVATGTNLCPAAVGNASSTSGTLGAVNITSVGTGRFRIVDATTTDATKRNGQATSSLVLMDFPAGATNGSYHADVIFTRGLLVDTSTAGTGVSSSTISYRCYN